MADKKTDKKLRTNVEMAAELLALQSKVAALDAALNSYDDSIRELVQTLGKEAPPELPDSSKWVTKDTYDMLNNAYCELRALNDKFVVDLNSLQKELRKMETELTFEKAERNKLELLFKQAPTRKSKRTNHKK